MWPDWAIVVVTVSITTIIFAVCVVVTISIQHRRQHVLLQGHGQRAESGSVVTKGLLTNPQWKIQSKTATQPPNRQSDEASYISNAQLGLKVANQADRALLPQTNVQSIRYSYLGANKSFRDEHALHLAQRRRKRGRSLKSQDIAVFPLSAIVESSELTPQQTPVFIQPISHSSYEREHITGDEIASNVPFPSVSTSLAMKNAEDHDFQSLRKHTSIASTASVGSSILDMAPVLRFTHSACLCRPTLGSKTEKFGSSDDGEASFAFKDKPHVRWSTQDLGGCQERDDFFSADSFLLIGGDSERALGESMRSKVEALKTRTSNISELEYLSSKPMTPSSNFLSIRQRRSMYERVSLDRVQSPAFCTLVGFDGMYEPVKDQVPEISASIASRSRPKNRSYSNSSLPWECATSKESIVERQKANKMKQLPRPDSRKANENSTIKISSVEQPETVFVHSNRSESARVIALDDIPSEKTRTALYQQKLKSPIIDIPVLLPSLPYTRSENLYQSNAGNIEIAFINERNSLQDNSSRLSNVESFRDEPLDDVKMNAGRIASQMDLDSHNPSAFSSPTLPSPILTADHLFDVEAQFQRSQRHLRYWPLRTASPIPLRKDHFQSRPGEVSNLRKSIMMLRSMNSENMLAGRENRFYNNIEELDSRPQSPFRSATRESSRQSSHHLEIKKSPSLAEHGTWLTTIEKNLDAKRISTTPSGSNVSLWDDVSLLADSPGRDIVEKENLSMLESGVLNSYEHENVSYSGIIQTRSTINSLPETSPSRNGLCLKLRTAIPGTPKSLYDGEGFLRELM